MYITENSWLEKIKSKESLENLDKKIDSIYESDNIYPAKESVLRAFNECPFEKIKVVILGQDPYHNEGQANGLAFSVPNDIKLPPSLRNIFKELKDDLGIEKDKGDLKEWSDQGVFLLNAVLTVEKNKPASHKDKGWEIFTDIVIQLLSDNLENVVFILWGNFAKNKQSLIDESKHLIITSPHPSPYSANSGFFGSKPFSKANEYLKKSDKGEISW